MSTLTTQTTIEEELNKTLGGVINAVKDNPENAGVSFTAHSELREGFRSTIKARDFEFISDEPENLGGQDEGPNPVEYVLGAFAACQEIVIKAHANQLGINIESVKVEVTGDLDLHGFFNLDDTRPGFTNLKYHTVITTDEQNPEKLEQLKDISQKNCPVLDIIKNPVPVQGELSYVN